MKTEYYTLRLSNENLKNIQENKLVFIQVENINLTISKEQVPAAVRNSEFGCKNCLWNGAECKSGKLYVEKVQFLAGANYISCEGYTYFD